MPADIQLPYPLTNDGLLKYYQYIQPMVVPARNSFHIVMAIPLMHSDMEYEINRAVQVPVPHLQGTLGQHFQILRSISEGVSVGY